MTEEGDDSLRQPEPISMELARRHFDAECQFNAALAAFQQDLQPVPDLNMATVVQAARGANLNGFCWVIRQDSAGVEVCLRHLGGAEEVSSADAVTPCSPALLLAGLLGLAVDPSVQSSKHDHVVVDVSEPQCPLRVGPAPINDEPEQPEQVVEEVADLMGPDSPPEIAGDHESLQALTPEEIEGAVNIIRCMTPAQRKSFSIAFRSAFNVPRTVVKIAGEICQLRHLHFVDRFSCEASGVAVP